MAKEKPKPTVMTSKSEEKVSATTHTNRMPLLFGEINYKMMLAGLVLILIGYGLMMGGNNADPKAAFPTEEIYSFRRIVLAPIVIIAGFIIEVFAILKIKK